MHIDKEVKALTTCFINLPLLIKSGLACKAQLPRSSSLSFLLILLRVWNLEQCDLKMTKGTTMVTNNGFGSTRLFRKGSSNMSLYSLQLMILRSYMTSHITMVASRNKLASVLRICWALALAACTLTNAPYIA